MEFPLLALRCVRGLVELRLVRVGGEERREERDAGRGERAGWGWVGWGRRGGELEAGAGSAPPVLGLVGAPLALSALFS
jgi:hypothetical protein